jgi:membrane-bound metal-dependent hydrolase YbcI (DUF457 family)
MYIGHVGVALGAKRLRASIGLFVLLLATYAPDWVDSGLCLAGAYSPDGVLSHSIPVVALLALLGFALYVIKTRDWTGAIIVAGVIVSHMLLDWITGYKRAWPGGAMIGLRLYDHPIADFILEGMLIVIGVVLYARTLPARRRAWIDVTTMLGALIVLQLGVDIAHLMLKSIIKC